MNLPLHRGAPRSRVTPTPDAAQPDELLLVEDDEALRQILALELAEMGYKVKTAGRCREARKVMAGGNIQSAILDVGLPDGNGIDLAGELATGHPRLRILLFSGGHGAFDERPVPSAVLDCLTKPLSARQLDRVLRSFDVTPKRTAPVVGAASRRDKPIR